MIINPKSRAKRASLLELTVAGTKEAINMVESGAKELSEELMLEALLKGHEAVKELIAFPRRNRSSSWKRKSRS